MRLNLVLKKFICSKKMDRTDRPEAAKLGYLVPLRPPNDQIKQLGNSIPMAVGIAVRF